MRVYLRQGLARNVAFQVRYAVHDTFGGTVVYLQTAPFTFDVGSMFITRLTISTS